MLPGAREGCDGMDRWHEAGDKWYRWHHQDGVSRVRVYPPSHWATHYPSPMTFFFLFWGFFESGTGGNQAQALLWGCSPFNTQDKMWSRGRTTPCLTFGGLSTVHNQHFVKQRQERWQTERKQVCQESPGPANKHKPHIWDICGSLVGNSKTNSSLGTFTSLWRKPSLSRKKTPALPGDLCLELVSHLTLPSKHVQKKAFQRKTQTHTWASKHLCLPTLNQQMLVRTFDEAVSDSSALRWLSTYHKGFPDPRYIP